MQRTSWLYTQITPNTNVEDHCWHSRFKSGSSKLWKDGCFRLWSFSSAAQLHSRKAELWMHFIYLYSQFVNNRCKFFFLNSIWVRWVASGFSFVMGSFLLAKFSWNELLIMQTKMSDTIFKHIWVCVFVKRFAHISLTCKNSGVYVFMRLIYSQSWIRLQHNSSFHASFRKCTVGKLTIN